MNNLKSAVAFFFLFFLHGTSIGNGQQGISYNGLRLCAVVRWLCALGELRIGAVISSYIKQFKIKKNGKTNRNRLIL